MKPHDGKGRPADAKRGCAVKLRSGRQTRDYCGWWLWHGMDPTKSDIVAYEVLT